MQKPKKHRLTRQRKTILEELRKVTSHPTADEIYQMVKKHLPKISLGTVYRNLEFLSRSGEIQKIEMDKNCCRYDGNPKKHYHIKCIICGRVDDLHDMPDMKITKKMHEITDWKITDYKLDFFGICPLCIKSGGKH